MPKTDKANKTRSGIQVIKRASKILRSLENESQGLSLAEIAKKVELPRSTVQRIVAALAEEQLVISASPNSHVKLGPALIRLASATNIDINFIVKPHIEKLSASIGETIDLSIKQGNSAVFIDQVPGTHRVRAVSAIGDRFSLHSSACGKALLAMTNPKKVEKYLQTSLDKHTDNTITDAQELRKTLQEVRENGYSLDEEENTEGVCALGTYFEDALGRIYAISIPAPTHRFSKNKENYKNALLECKAAILDSLH